MESSPVSNQALPPGTRIEEFVIERVLGAGGFGITYLARDVRLARQVVIKENLPAQFCFRDTHSLTVAPRHSQGEDAENFRWSLENFSKEAAMLASLDHPGIVKVLRSFEAFGTAYFVMPFVEGMALDDMAKQRGGKPFSEAELKSWLGRILEALGHLHDRGIYHRDIKPGNLLITNSGIPVLIDFGSARQRLSERSLTVVESAGYTPFEQLESRGNVGPWSDLYALGGTLVKVITGETPPKANDRMRKDPYVPLAERAELQGGLSMGFLQSIDQALAVDEENRWQSAGEWLVALAAPVVQAPSPQIGNLPLRRIGVCRLEHRPGEERDFDLTARMKLRMCWIPPGEFLMGSPEGEPGRELDETQHRVKITRGFWMGKYPVTQGQWEAVMGNRPSYFGTRSMWDRFSGGNLKELWDEYPVESVSWNDVCGKENRTVGFLDKVNGGRRSGECFHLPTEAQWEYACRAGKTGPHAGNLYQMAWFGDNSGSKTHPVGGKQANAWGLHDMHGNVWEWCSDWYEKGPEGGVNPQGPDKGVHRALRGGSWHNTASRCRAASRSRDLPDNRSFDLGFRLALVPSE
jgi:formylglycine-generating enzyme required for sulfatase activity